MRSAELLFGFQIITQSNNLKAEKQKLSEKKKRIAYWIITILLALGNVKPKILERQPIIERITQKVYHFMDTFIRGMASDNPSAERCQKIVNCTDEDTYGDHLSG